MIFNLREYFLPCLVSLVFHGLLLFAVARVTHKAPEKPDFKRPEYVKATLVELKTKAPEKKVSSAAVQKVDLTADKNKDTSQQLKRQQQEAAAKQAKALKEKQAADAKQKAAKEKAVLEKEKLEKAAALKKAKDEERKRKQEAIDRALREEEMMIAEQEEAQTVNSFKAIIMERIAQKWSRPPSARNGMRCELVIQLVPTGKIITVNIVKGSGNDAFDRSAEQAVRAVDQIPELKNMDTAVFDRNFRTITLLFNPEDRRL